jgi:hypothetical protein
MRLFFRRGPILGFQRYGQRQSRISCPFPKWPLKILLINPGASHAGLSDLYSEMPLDMKTVAKTFFGKEVLSKVSAEGIL